MKMKEIVNTFITGEELRESNTTSFRRLKDNFSIRNKEAINEVLPHISDIITSKNGYTYQAYGKPKLVKFILELKFPKNCPITGIELDYDYDKKRVSGGGDSSPSYDKIIPKKGYVEGNVRIVSFLGNKVMTSINDRKYHKLIFNHMIKFLQKELGEAK